MFWSATPFTQALFELWNRLSPARRCSWEWRSMLLTGNTGGLQAADLATFSGSGLTWLWLVLVGFHHSYSFENICNSSNTVLLLLVVFCHCFFIKILGGSTIQPCLLFSGCYLNLCCCRALRTLWVTQDSNFPTDLKSSCILVDAYHDLMI